ncbi:MAG TPA: NUDIX hydrolase [Candidatus Binataceae bacterium]|nr:NUDIX hydrolase [Candidatus Binataceae bacterium]
MAEQQFYVGVHGVIANRGRILVLRRAERMPYRPGSWDLPGGHLAAGESFEQCLVREVKEETALDVSIDRLLGLNAMPVEPYLQALYECRLTVYQTVRLRADEHAEHSWVTPEELRNMNLIPYLEAFLKRGLLAFVRG